MTMTVPGRVSRRGMLKLAGGAALLSAFSGTLAACGGIGAGIGAKVMRDRAAHATQPGWVIIGPHEDGGLW